MTATQTHPITPLTDPSRLLPRQSSEAYGRLYHPLPDAFRLVAAPIYAGTRYDIYEDAGSTHCTVPVCHYMHQRHSDLHQARIEAQRAAGIDRQRKNDNPRPVDIHQAYWRRTLTVDQVLADAGMRQAAAEQAAKWAKKSVSEGVLAWASDAVVAEAVQRMRVRLARRADRQIAGGARLAASGRIAQMDANRRQTRCRALAVAVAGRLHRARPLVTSQYAHITWGSTGGVEQVEWDRYRRTKYPCKYHDAGVALGDDLCIRVYDSRGSRIYTSRPLTREDWMDSDVTGRAAHLLGVCSDAVLDAVGPQGEDDAVQIREPYLICDSLLGVVIGDHPTQPTIVQVVVRDSTTGQRHHLTVPPRFGRPLNSAKHETSYDRCRAAIAWTFGIAPSQYRPTVQA